VIEKTGKNIYKVSYKFEFDGKLYENTILAMANTIPEVYPKVYNFIASGINSTEKTVTLVELNVCFFKRSDENFVII
jgi:hypothetical protein